MKRNFLKWLVLCLLCSGIGLSQVALAKNVVVGRYLTVQTGATSSEVMPLQSVFDLTLPSNIQTVGQAMRYLLANTGYQLAPARDQNRATQDLLTQPLPLTDRSLRMMTVLQALQVLSGADYQILIDPKHRWLSFILKPTFKKLYDNPRNDL